MIKKIYIPLIFILCTVFFGLQSLNAATYVQPLYGTQDILEDTGTTLPAEIKQYGVGTVVSKTSAISAEGTTTLFTVTGEVEMVIVGYIDVAMTGTTGTLEVGIAGTTAGLVAQAAQAALLIDLLWVDATPAAIIVKPTYKVVANGADVIETAGGTVTASTVTYYCYWRPLSSDGNVVAA